MCWHELGGTFLNPSLVNVEEVLRVGEGVRDMCPNTRRFTEFPQNIVQAKFVRLRDEHLLNLNVNGQSTACSATLKVPRPNMSLPHSFTRYLQPPSGSHTFLTQATLNVPKKVWVRLKPKEYAHSFHLRPPALPAPPPANKPERVSATMAPAMRDWEPARDPKWRVLASSIL